MQTVTHIRQPREDIDSRINSLTTALAAPIPPVVWFFGSGLLGLIGVARRKVRVQY